MGWRTEGSKKPSRKRQPSEPEPPPPPEPAPEDNGQPEQQNLRELREELGLTREQVAARIPTSVGRIGDWERGDMAPSFESLMSLTRALDQDIRAVAAAVEESRRRKAEEADDG